jgi:TLC domain
MSAIHGEHPAVVPDAVILVLSLCSFLFALAVQRNVVSPRFSSTYRHASAGVQFDWDQRVLSLLFQALQTAFNFYILFFSPATQKSPLYGYSVVAHVGFVITCAYYLFDAILLVVHPDVAYGSYGGAWMVHHLFAAAVLIWQTSILRMSALPASTFLISSAGHVGNEIRWFLRTAGFSSRRVHNALSVACNVILFVTCVLPPPWLVYSSAQQHAVGWCDMLTSVMRVQCVVGYWVVWLPHCVLFVVQVRRTLRHWSGEVMKHDPERSRKEK